SVESPPPEAPLKQQHWYLEPDATLARALLPLRPRSFDHAIDLSRTQKVGSLPFRIFADNSQDFRLRGSEFYVFAKTHEHCSRRAAFLDHQRMALAVYVVEYLPEISSRPQGGDDHSIGCRCRHELYTPILSTVQFGPSIVNRYTGREMTESTIPVPPTARKSRTETQIHGVPLADDYAWLRDKENPDV